LLGDLVVVTEKSTDVRKGENKVSKAEKPARVPINDSDNDSDEGHLAKQNSKKEKEKVKEKEKELKSKKAKDNENSPIYIDAPIPTSRSGRVIQTTQRFDPMKIVPATEEYQMDSSSASKEKKPLSVRSLNSGSLSRLDLLASTDIDDEDGNNGWGAATNKSSSMAMDSTTKAATKLSRKSRSEVVEAEMILIQNQKNASTSSISRSRHVVEDDNIDISASPELDSLSIGADNAVIDKNQRKRAKIIDDDDDESDGIMPFAVETKANKPPASSGKVPCNAIFLPSNKENNVNSDTWPDSSYNNSDLLDSASQSSKNKPAIDLNDEIKLSQNQWSCLSCTFINDKRVNSICCNICAEPRPRTKSKVSLKDSSKSSLRR
jgi:hypothetical protein